MQHRNRRASYTAEDTRTTVLLLVTDSMRHYYLIFEA
jgi:hypothetical protein